MKGQSIELLAAVHNLIITAFSDKLYADILSHLIRHHTTFHLTSI